MCIIEFKGEDKMKYIKYTIYIMIVVSILSFCKTNAIGIGQLTINFVGNVETGAQ